ncbi:hypothetical protein D9M72_615570 [compost metagenome]
MGVRIGAAHVVGNGTLQVFRRAEPEVAGVADVQLDQLAALRLQLTRSPCQFAPDLVADFGQALAGGKRLQRGRGHDWAVVRAWKSHTSGNAALQGKGSGANSQYWRAVAADASRMGA